MTVPPSGSLAAMFIIPRPVTAADDDIREYNGFRQKPRVLIK